MGSPSSKSSHLLKRGMMLVGFLVFLVGVNWLWNLRDIWPRATTDPVPHHCLEAIGVMIGGLYVVSKGR